MILIALVIIAAITGAIFLLGKGKLERTAHVAHIAEGLAVVGALVFAIFEYTLHHDADAARKREAATAILARSFNTAYVDDALGNVYRKYNPDHVARREEDYFDNDTGSLMSYFWAINACVANDLCSLETVLNIYCDDYVTYVGAYERVHGPTKTEEEFGNLQSLNQCKYRNADVRPIPPFAKPAPSLSRRPWHFP